MHNIISAILFKYRKKYIVERWLKHDSRDLSMFIDDVTLCLYSEYKHNIVTQDEADIYDAYYWRLGTLYERYR